MVKKKSPWCIEVEYNNGNVDYFVVRRFVADVKDIHLYLEKKPEETGTGQKLSISRLDLHKVMIISSTKGT